MAATYGRGVYAYRFANPTSSGPGCRDRIAPVSRIRGLRATRHGLSLRGTTTDRGCGAKGRGKVRRVLVSFGRATGRQCRFIDSRNRLHARRSCLRTQYFLRVRRGKHGWTLRFNHRLARAGYKIWVRGIDAAGNVERKHFKRNGRVFRVR